MTDLLTKEEREMVESVRHQCILDALNPNRGTSWTGAQKHRTALLTIIDNLSKRGVKKYSEKEILMAWRDAKDVSADAYTLDGAVWFARFLGVLEEK